MRREVVVRVMGEGLAAWCAEREAAPSGIQGEDRRLEP